MKQLINEMGILQFLAMCFVILFVVFGVIDCTNGTTKTIVVHVIDKEYHVSYDKHHRATETFYVHVESSEGLHHVSVSRIDYFHCVVGETKRLKIYYGKYSHIGYVETLF